MENVILSKLVAYGIVHERDRHYLHPISSKTTEYSNREMTNSLVSLTYKLHLSIKNKYGMAYKTFLNVYSLMLLIFLSPPAVLSPESGSRSQMNLSAK